MSPVIGTQLGGNNAIIEVIALQLGKLHLTSAGNLMLIMLAAVAQMERDLSRANILGIVK